MLHMMVHLINLFKQLKQTPTLVNFSLVQLSPSLFCILFILPVQWRDMVPWDNLTWEKPAQRQFTLGSDVTLHLVEVFVIVSCRTLHVGAELAP